MTTYRTVLVSAEYRKYLGAGLLAAIGSGMYFVAVSWYLFQTSGATMAIGWALIASTLPGLLFSPVVGVLVDRWNPKHVCAVADVLRGVTLLLLGMGMATRTLAPVHIYAASFVVALCDNFFQPAVAALVRDVVSKEQLLPANIVGSMSIQIGALAGASLGGIAVTFYGTETVVFLNAVSFMVSAALIASIRYRMRPTARPQTVPERGVVAQFRRALRETPERTYLMMIAGQQICAYLTVFLCNTLLPGFVTRDLRAGAPAFGLIDAGWGVGAMLGGLALHAALKRTAAGVAGACGLVVFGCGMAGMAAAQSAWQAAACYVLLGCMGVMIRINGDTEIVRIAHQSHFGKIKSGVVMVISWCSLLVYACVGYLGDLVSARLIYLVTALVLVGAGVAFGIAARRSASTVPEPTGGAAQGAASLQPAPAEPQ